MTTPNDLIRNWKMASEINRSGTSAIDTRLSELVQSAYTSIYDMDDWSFKNKESTIVTISATSSYALASDFRWPQPSAFSIKLSDDSEITFMDEPAWNARNRTQENAKPTQFRIGWDTTTSAWKFFPWPVPDAVYTIYVPYVAKAATLTGSTAIPLPDAHVTAVEDLFYALAYKEYNRAGRYATELKGARMDAMQSARRLHTDDRSQMIDQPADVYGDINDLSIGFDEGY